MLDAFWAAPPVTRTLVAATFLISALVHGDAIQGERVVFAWEYLWQFPPEVWRIATSFLITRPKIAIIMDPFFLWQYGTALETESLRFANPGDFFMYIIFVAAVTLVLASNLLGASFYTDALMVAIAYTYAQENRGKKVKFIIITMDVKWLPFALIFLTFVNYGVYAAQLQLMGIPAAHLYDFLTRLWPQFGGGTRLINTPLFVSRWFGGGGVSVGGARAPQVSVKGPVTVFRPPPTTSTWSSGWGSRGQGRRLGGD